MEFSLTSYISLSFFLISSTSLSIRTLVCLGFHSPLSLFRALAFCSSFTNMFVCLQRNSEGSAWGGFLLLPFGLIFCPSFHITSSFLCCGNLSESLDSLPDLCQVALSCVLCLFLAKQNNLNLADYWVCKMLKSYYYRICSVCTVAT